MCYPLFSLGVSCNGLEYYACPHLKANTCTWKIADGQNSLLEVPYCLKMTAQNQLAAVGTSHLFHASDIGMLDVDPCWHFIFCTHVTLILHISFGHFVLFVTVPSFIRCIQCFVWNCISCTLFCEVLKLVLSCVSVCK